MNDKTLEELRYYFNGYGSRHDETILKLIDQNKRYREALEILLKESRNYEKNTNLISFLEKALEGDLE